MQKSKILAFLLALVVSIVLWFYAVTVVNPDDTITISGISVQFEGTEALTSQGLMLTGGDSTKVSIKVSGRRSDLKELNNETVTAIADVTRIAASGSYQLSWSVVWPSTVATGDISETSRAPSRISVTVSDIKENPEVPIELEYTGEPKTGYMIDKSNLTLGTQSISVRGPAEEVNKIARAVVRVDVTDADALIDTGLSRRPAGQGRQHSDGPLPQRCAAAPHCQRAEAAERRRPFVRHRTDVLKLMHLDIPAEMTGKPLV